MVEEAVAPGILGGGSGWLRVERCEFGVVGKRCNFVLVFEVMEKNVNFAAKSRMSWAHISISAMLDSKG